MPRPKGPPGNFRLVLCPDGGTERGAQQYARRRAANVGVLGRILLQERQDGEADDFATVATAHVKDSELTRWEYP
jgi:hypothetical protein